MQEFKKLLILSIKNLKSRKWLHIKIVTALVSLTFILSIFAAFTTSVGSYAERRRDDNVSCNYICSEKKVDTLPKLKQRLDKTCVGFSKDRILQILDIQDYKDFSFYLLYSNISIVLNGQICKFQYDPSLSEYVFEPVFGDEVFTENDYTSLRRIYGYDNFIIGKTPSAPNEVVVSGNMLGCYGLTPEDVLNKDINFTFHATVDKVKYSFNYLPDMKVTGVIRSEYSELYGHEFSLVSKFIPSVILSETSELLNDSEILYERYVYSFSDWLTDEEVDVLVDEGLIENTSYYNARSLFNWLQYQSQFMSILSNIFIFAGGARCVGIIFMIYLSIDKFVKYFSRSAGILSVSGLKNESIKTVILIQLVILCLISAAISFALTVGTAYLINFILTGTVIIGYDFSFLNVDYIFYLTAIGVELLISAIAVACTYAISYVSVKNKSVKQLLDAGNL